MSDQENNFKEKFKQALISTARVISDDYKIDVKNYKKNLNSKDNNFFEIDSLSNKSDFIKLRAKTDSLALKKKFSNKEIFYNNLNPKCEPQLGRRGLYNMVGGQKNSIQNMLPIFWVLNLSDGTNSISDIVKKSNLEIQDIKNAINILIKKNLLKMDTK